MRARDWRSTPLGAPETWPQSLRTSVSTCLNCSFPILLWWGPRLIKLYNNAYAAILGDKHPAALGSPGQDVWPEIWDVIGPMLARVMQQGQPTRAEDLLLLLRRHGYAEECYFSFSYSPIRDESGGVGGVFCPVIEVTEKVIGARRLQTLSALGELTRGGSAEDAAAAAMQVLAGNDADLPFALVYVIDRAAGLARLAGTAGIPAGNAAAPPTIPLNEKITPWPMTGLPAEGRRIEALSSRFDDLPCGAWPDPPEQAMVLPVPLRGEAEADAVLVAAISPRKRLDDAYLSFLGLVARQLGARMAEAIALAEERRHVQALAELDRAKTAFFSNVSHEFRTPLTLLLGPLEALQEYQGLGDDARRQVELAHRSATRLLRLVNTLLDFARIEAGRARACYRPTDLAALTAELAAGFRSALERAGLFLAVDCPTLPEPVFADRDMWEKLVLNLLSNAFKFTFSGGVAVRLRAEGGHAVLRVRDTGVGIAAADLPRVFDRFHRIEGQRSRSFEGSGIGLALVQDLARLHGGAIEASSKPGEGSEFVVRLPFGRAHLPADQMGDAAPTPPAPDRSRAYVEEALGWLPEPAASGETAAAPEGALRARILLADDNADMRAYVCRLLGAEHRVTAVPDGEAALAALRRDRPDLVITDVMMPGLDGFGLLRAIRADPALRDLPVLMLSARAGEESRIEGLQAGADDYVAKPFSAPELRARVGAHLALARQRRDAAQAVLDSAERLRRMFEQAPGFMCMLRGPQHVFELANGAYLRVVGRRDLIGKPVREAFPELSGEVFFELLDRVYQTGKAFTGRGLRLLLWRGPDQPRAEVFVDFVYQPITDAEGRVTGIFVEGVDVTERARAEAELREQKLQFEVVLETVPAAVWFTGDRDARRITGNRTAAELLRLPPSANHSLSAEPQEAPGHFRFRREGLPIAPEALPMQRAARGEDVPAEEYEIAFTDGSTAMVLVRARPLRGPDGEPEGAVCVGTDISDRKRSEQELRRLNERLEARVAEEVAAREQVQAHLAQAQRMEALGQLAGGIAHDFNNVLQAVRGGLGLIEKRAGDTGAVRELARMAGEAAARGGAITSRLLAFARRGELQAEAVRPLLLLESVREILVATLGAEIAVELRVREDAPALLADRAQLETVLVNLAVNARDAMPGGGTLILSASPETVAGTAPHLAGLRPGGYLRLEVTDTGIGMDAATLERAAEPFFTTKPPGQGTGLGLAMARGFAEQSDGGFAIGSSPGRGTTVTLWFPCASRDAARRPAKPKDAHPPGAERAAHVLVVDDDSMVRTVLARQMQALGYRVSEAPDGLAALAQLDAGDPAQLLVTDFSMPGMNGLLLIEEARKRHPGLPALLLTGYADVGVREALVAGDRATVLLRKPVADQDLARHAAAMLAAAAAV